MWKAIPGWPYEVSDRGLVRRIGGRIKSPSGTHYAIVSLWRDGKPTYRYVHHLVLEAFRGPCPQGMERAHQNGRHRDNLLCNLRYKTKKENEADKLRHGTFGKKFSPLQVLAVRSAKGTQREIGARFGMSQSMVSDIKNGVKWGCV